MKTFTFEWPNQGSRKVDWQRDLENVANAFKSCFEDVSKTARHAAGRKLYGQVDMAQDDTNLYIELDLAGIRKEDIEITSGIEHTIRITGKRSTDTERNYIRRERWTGTFERTVKIPEGMEVDIDKASASYENGVLSITIPKIVPVQEPQRTITIL